MKTRLWLYSQGGWLRWPARTVCKARPSYQVIYVAMQGYLFGKPMFVVHELTEDKEVYSTKL